jgi:hypothetical protein
MAVRLACVRSKWAAWQTKITHTLTTISCRSTLGRNLTHELGCKRLLRRRKLTPTMSVSGAMVKTTRVSANMPTPAANIILRRDKAAPATARIAATSTPPGTIAATIAARAFDSLLTLGALQGSFGPTWICTGSPAGCPHFAHGSESWITVRDIDHTAIPATGAAARNTRNNVITLSLRTVESCD